MVKAVVKIEGTDSPVSVRFNPENYTVTSTPEIKKSTIVGANGEHIQFISGGGSVLSMVLHYDTYNTPLKETDVRALSKPLTDLIKKDGEQNQPPLVTFVYGSFMFKGVVTKANQKFTMFSRQGIPVRCELTFEVTKTVSVDEQISQPKDSSENTKVCDVLDGDQLWMVSNNEYDSPEHWRSIAEANDIDNPRLLNDKSKLTVPVLENK
jgi:nucleoid-associated protein YgaU